MSTMQLLSYMYHYPWDQSHKKIYWSTLNSIFLSPPPHLTTPQKCVRHFQMIHQTPPQIFVLSLPQIYWNGKKFTFLHFLVSGSFVYVQRQAIVITHFPLLFSCSRRRAFPTLLEIWGLTYGVFLTEVFIFKYTSQSFSKPDLIHTPKSADTLKCP